MSAHLRKRAGSLSWYIIDGEYRKSTRTAKRGLAEARLKQYLAGKFGVEERAPITLGEYYEGWIERMREPIVRRGWIWGTRSVFKCHILPELRTLPFAGVTPVRLESFRAALQAKGLGMKTIRDNVFASLRSMWREAEREGVARYNPISALRWPKLPRLFPDPFTQSERDEIVAYFKEREPFYYPLVLLHAETGMRPSEAAGLKWEDIDLERGTISISRSYSVGKYAAPKTERSRRTIGIGPELAAALRSLHSYHTGGRVLISKTTTGINLASWAKAYWRPALKDLGIRWRKFYALRHAHITECVNVGYDLLSIARYHGTSVKMIEDNYCGAVNMTLNLKVGSTIPAHPDQIMQENPQSECGRYPQAENGRDRDDPLTIEKDSGASRLRRVKSA